MFTITEIVQPETLEEAYSILVSRKNNVVLGGCAFLKMGSKKIGTGTDLSKLNLDSIEESENKIEIGACVTFRQLETSPYLNSYFNGILREAVSNIIGVQFRNVVNVGATVFSKYGFSDLITALLSLDTEVELYKGGRMHLAEFLVKPYEKDILTKIYIEKNKRKAVFKDFRNSESDYPILNVAVSEFNGIWRIVAGARPMGAKIASDASKLLTREPLGEKIIEEVAQIASEELVFGSNMRGSGEYRKALCKVLIMRAIKEVQQCR